MLLTIRRSGGYAALGGRSTEIDTSKLPQQARTQAESCLETILKAEPAQLQAIGADLPTYHIEVGAPDGPRTERTIVDDWDMNRPIVRALHQLLEAAGIQP